MVVYLARCHTKAALPYSISSPNNTIHHSRYYKEMGYLELLLTKEEYTILLLAFQAGVCYYNRQGIDK